jgi:4-hydroxybenzoyl-CoA reductase subunit beta
MEYLPKFKLHRPQSIEQAVSLHSENDGACYVAGGSDMLVNIRRGIEQPAALIDLSQISELGEIREAKDGMRIGATVTLERLAAHAAIARDYAAVPEASASIAGPTHRAYGTVGGNLCLDTRCIYYNQSEWWRSSNAYCLKHRGEICHVAPGGESCFAAYSGDLAPALLVHHAQVELIGGDGRRQIPLADFFRDDGMDHLAIEKGEILASVLLPKASAGLPSAYAKSRIRGAIDFPVAGLAALLKLRQGKIETLRIALTAVNPRPLVIDGTEAFVGAEVSDGVLDKLAELASTQAKPMTTTTVSPWYRRRVTGALARRLVARLAEGE